MRKHAIITGESCTVHIKNCMQQSRIGMWAFFAGVVVVKRILSPAGSWFTISTVGVLNPDSLDETPDDVADLSSSYSYLRLNRNQVFLHAPMVDL